MAGEINVLSGAAVEPGLIAATEIFRRRTSNAVNVKFATTPDMRRLIAAGETPDVVIAPPAALDEFAKSGRIDAATRVLLGRVGIGVAVRDGAPRPDISTIEAFKRTVLDAESVVYNRASSGLYIEALMHRLGLAEQIEAKTKRYTGTDMIEPLIKGKGLEIGFLPVVQILNYRGRGLQLAGPLPSAIQNQTSYVASPAPQSEAGLAFTRFLQTEEARATFASVGVEP